MATGYRRCKVCGKEYEYCRTNRRVSGVFRWQDVACCEEHGAEYLQSVLEARGEAPVAKTKSSAKKSTAKKVEPVEVIDEEDEDIDELFDEEFEDDDEEDDEEDS